jgi:hypothetical protein
MHHAICHCTVFAFDQELAQHLYPNSYHRALVPHPSTSCLLLLYIDLHVTSRGWVDVRDQGIMPSVAALCLRFLPILTTVRSYPILQLLVFVCCPFTRTGRRRVDARLQGPMHAISCDTAVSFDQEPVWQFSPNSWYHALLPHPSTSCFCLPFNEPSGRCWRPRHDAICRSTVV